MRRSVSMLRTAAALAALLAGATTASASAALGILTVNGVAYENPSGCLTLSQTPQTLTLVNDTNMLVDVYQGPSCTGERIAVLSPGMNYETQGSSVYVP